MNDKNFLYLHIKKAGGTNMKNTLKDVYNEVDKKRSKTFIFYDKDKWNDVLNNFRIPLGEYDYRRMLCAKEVLYTYEEFEDMFKFTIVRNPYARIVSSWKYLTSGDLKWILANKFVQKMSFRKFLEILPDVWKNIRYPGGRLWATHTAPMTPDLVDRDGSLLVDYVAKLENIQEDFDHICEKIGIEKREFPTPSKDHKTDKKHYSHYYTEQSKNLVEKYFGKDISKFNYKFEKK